MPMKKTALIILDRTRLTTPSLLGQVRDRNVPMTVANANTNPKIGNMKRSREKIARNLKTNDT
jgi:hypothetical protein